MAHKYTGIFFVFRRHPGDFYRSGGNSSIVLYSIGFFSIFFFNIQDESKKRKKKVPLQSLDTGVLRLYLRISI